VDGGWRRVEQGSRVDGGHGLSVDDAVPCGDAYAVSLRSCHLLPRLAISCHALPSAHRSCHAGSNRAMPCIVVENSNYEKHERRRKYFPFSSRSRTSKNIIFKLWCLIRQKLLKACFFLDSTRRPDKKLLCQNEQNSSVRRQRI
jgi:hypothetical protein